MWVFGEMTYDDAATIAAWRYEEPYAFYDLDKDARDLAEFLDDASWRIGELRQQDTIVAVRRAGELSGYFSYVGGPDLCTIGLGLAPELTGRSLGEGFVQAGLAFARATWGVTRFRLEVASFNERAMKLYERIGFVKVRTLIHEDGGQFVEFVEMTLG